MPPDGKMVQSLGVLPIEPVGGAEGIRTVLFIGVQRFYLSCNTAYLKALEPPSKIAPDKQTLENSDYWGASRRWFVFSILP
jgi:hypothetical protein